MAIASSSDADTNNEEGKDCVCEMNVTDQPHLRVVGVRVWLVPGLLSAPG